MELKIIYSSKLYKASSRKDKIRANINNPINVELVQQIADYVDVNEPEQLDTKVNKPSESVVKRSDHPAPNRGADKINHSSESDVSPSDDIEPMPGLIADDKTISDEPQPAQPEDESAEEINESEKLTDDTVQGVEGICSSIDINQIKDELNDSPLTEGVIRVANKAREIWVYFNDNTNLNDIMVNVIDSIFSRYGAQLEFNRLARSENAMVFIEE